MQGIVNPRYYPGVHWAFVITTDTNTSWIPSSEYFNEGNMVSGNTEKIVSQSMLRLDQPYDRFYAVVSFSEDRKVLVYGGWVMIPEAWYGRPYVKTLPPTDVTARGATMNGIVNRGTTQGSTGFFTSRPTVLIFGSLVCHRIW